MTETIVHTLLTENPDGVIAVSVHLTSDEMWADLRKVACAWEPEKEDAIGMFSRQQLIDYVTEKAGFIVYMEEHKLSAPSPEIIVMQVEEDDDGDFPYLAICPYPDCNGEEFWEVDIAERWNPMQLDEIQDDELVHYDYANGRRTNEHRRPNPLAGLPFFTTAEGSNGDGYATDHYLCQSCTRHVNLPVWLQSEWIS